MSVLYLTCTGSGKKRLDLILAVHPRSNGRGRPVAYRGGGRRRRRRRRRRRLGDERGDGSGRRRRLRSSGEGAAWRGGEVGGGRRRSGSRNGARRRRQVSSGRELRRGRRLRRRRRNGARGLGFYRRGEEVAWRRGQERRSPAGRRLRRAVAAADSRLESVARG